MGWCCVPECKTVSNSGLHCFPADHAIAKKWVRFTRTFHLDMNKLSQYRVCENHFKESDLITDMNGRKCVKRSAIPSLFLPPDLNTCTEHNYFWNYKIRKRPKPRPRTYFSKKKLAAVSNAILTNDAITVNNVGNEMEIGELNEEQQPPMDPWIMLAEANKRIKILEEQVNQTNKGKAVLSRRNRINGKKLKKYKEELKKNKKNRLLDLMEEQNFNKQQTVFMMMQFKNSNRKANGRRYTNEEKSLALAIYKQGPKCYRFLQRIFTLPSKRTLGRHSAELIFESGIDPKFFEFVKEKVKDMSPSDALCTISWDEVSLKPNLNYSVNRDQIDGFVELANVRRPIFATHSLTFMVRGINTAYKQPVVFFYTNGLKSFELAGLITLVTEAVLETGLNVIGSTCDQVGINVAAIHYLVYRDSRRRTPNGSLLSYEISGRKIIHIYDPPHLIKVLRNNLEKKNLRHFISQRYDILKPDNRKARIAEKQEKLASWTHVAYLYHIDSKSYHRRLKKITDEHIIPKALKMKVSVATQVFSETYGEVMIDYCKKNQLPAEFEDTAQILLFFNDVFDSMNGSHHPQSSTLKGSVYKDSAHFGFWTYAVEMLSKMSFINIEKGTVSNSSTILKKFASTIKGFAEITRICLESNMTQVALRNTNQDGLENFFGSVKGCCQNAKAPIAIHYRTGYATMIINNVVGSNSLSTNCEPDSTIPLLNDLHEFFLKFRKDNDCESNSEYSGGMLETIVFNPQSSEMELNVSENYCGDMLETIVFNPQPSEMALNVSENDSLAHISNSICGKVLKAIGCENCRKNIEISTNGASYPSQVFLENFEKIFSYVNREIPTICSKKLLRKTLISDIEDMEIGCPEHHKDVSSKMKEICINYALFSFCKNINSFLSGRNTNLPTDSNDMQQLAYAYFLKKKRVGKFTDILTL